jgi:hypothetical protein
MLQHLQLVYFFIIYLMAWQSYVGGLTFEVDLVDSFNFEIDLVDSEFRSSEMKSNVTIWVIHVRHIL